jgi:hypothetical protein
MRTAVALVLLLVLLGGCQSSRKQLLAADKSQVQLRSIQSRAFDTTDLNTMLRTVMATLQDLEFVIDNADATLGIVKATKLDRGSVRVTVTVRPRGEKQLIVRANAHVGIEPVSDPEPYQRFFTSLSKAIFLEAHHVE